MAGDWDPFADPSEQLAPQERPAPEGHVDERKSAPSESDTDQKHVTVQGNSDEWDPFAFFLDKPSNDSTRSSKETQAERVEDTDPDDGKASVGPKEQQASSYDWDPFRFENSKNENAGYVSGVYKEKVDERAKVPEAFDVDWMGIATEVRAALPSRPDGPGWNAEEFQKQLDSLWQLQSAEQIKSNVAMVCKSILADGDCPGSTCSITSRFRSLVKPYVQLAMDVMPASLWQNPPGHVKRLPKCAELLQILTRGIVAVGGATSSFDDIFISRSVKEISRPKVVILCLGYGGGHLDDIKEFLPMYENLMPHHTAVLAVPYMFDDFGKRHHKLIFTSVTEALAETHALGHKPQLLVHLCSNLGMMGWIGIMHQWSEWHAKLAEQKHPKQLPTLREVVVGVIHDSSPHTTIHRKEGELSGVQSLIATLIRYISPEVVMPSLTAERHVCCLVAPPQSPVRKVFADQSDREVHASSRVDLQEILSLQPNVPLFFVYSKKDRIIVAAGTEEYMDEMEINGFMVRSKKFEGSDHCKHFQMYPSEYETAVKNFLKATCTMRGVV
eukprot:gnl/MRDRNA2_/MRDRNA2_204370_c0_seq1.p1 gnl/MRDRNA2_/MRDRNA2_204370_c0~~gnl/MRDRNA2_/MRDRNA2_204370_c0_seq1.p1  ORF type:complete len:556 (-),score=99.73 gnl/MRDRNA2_/MRDRNA2_204370_c0_seq1:102-1769(-)